MGDFHLIAASGALFSRSPDLFCARQGFLVVLVFFWCDFFVGLFFFCAFLLSFAKEFDRSTIYVVKKHLLLSSEPPISRKTSISIF